MTAYTAPTIIGLRVKELKVIPDERGRLMEILRADDELFDKFGQVYMTTTLPGVVKAWHLHRIQTDNVCCLTGAIKLAVFDDRHDSSTKGQVNFFYLGRDNPLLIHIPPGLYHGWKCVSLEEAVIINTVSDPFDRDHPDEVRLDPHDNHIPFSWERRDG
ncbi:MAG: dTDP-4-dehydrorhamnose 3,5-epimerase family protein [Deltaproteobacteria bacterium]|nr:dTDP-4-dehydrorhamnose 3,5-epimerase family protein [Deltaproteobacteria bacterium]